MASSLHRPQTAVRARGSNKCPHHQGMEVVFLCEDDGELICAKCVATIHKKHAVEVISDVIPQVKVTIQDFINKTESTHLPKFYEKVKNLDGEISRNKSHYKNVIAKIQNQNENLKLELDKITNKTIMMCSECEKQNEDIIKTHKTKLQSTIEELNARLHKLKETLQAGTDTEIYDTSRDIPNDVTIPTLPSLQDMDFKSTSILIDQLEKLFGQLWKMDNGNKVKLPADDVTRPKTYATTDDAPDTTETKKKTTASVAEFKLFETFEHDDLDISRIQAISDKNQIWVKGGDSILALLTNTGRVLKRRKMNVDIADFCVSPSTGDVWFCNSQTDTVRKVNGGKKSKGLVMFHTHTIPLSICISVNDNILVGMARQIVKYTQCGQTLCKSSQVKEVPVVRYPQSISECPITRNIAVVDSDSEVCRGDGKKHVSILSEDLQLLCRYYGRDIEYFKPCDLCYSDTGDIYIANNDGSVLRISGQGDFIQTVYTVNGNEGVVCLCAQSNGDIYAVVDTFWDSGELEVFSATSVHVLKKQ